MVPGRPAARSPLAWWLEHAALRCCCRQNAGAVCLQCPMLLLLVVQCVMLLLVVQVVQFLYLAGANVMLRDYDNKSAVCPTCPPVYYYTVPLALASSRPLTATDCLLVAADGGARTRPSRSCRLPEPSKRPQAQPLSH